MLASYVWIPDGDDGGCGWRLESERNRKEREMRFKDEDEEVSWLRVDFGCLGLEGYA